MSLLQDIRESDRVFIIAVAGDSGSGKTTFSRGITRILGDEYVTSFSLDDYHSLDREQRKDRGITPLHPDANRLDLLAEHLEQLRSGRSIEKPVYDHSCGAIKGSIPFQPRPVVIIEGLHPFYTKELRHLTDIKIFVDPSRAVKRKWKLRRDVCDRGYAPSQVRKEILEREPDYKLYVDIQKIYAEIVIKIQESAFHPPWMEEPHLETYSVRLIQELLKTPGNRVDMAIDLSKLMRISDREFSIEFLRDDYYGKKVSVLTFDGELRFEMVTGIEAQLAAMTKRRIGDICDRSDGYVSSIGLTQLLLSWRCLERLEEMIHKS